MDLRKVFGATLKKLRKSRGISQEQLALRADLDRAHISKLENGAYQPNLETMMSISEVLGIKTSELVAEVENSLEQE